MSGVNKVILIGRLGRDPELRHTKGGTAVANMSIATDDSFKDKQGNIQKTTEWHRIVMWDKTAENCVKYLSKGSQVYVEGKLQTRKWEDKDGQERTTTEIVARNVTFLDSKSDRQAQGEGRGQGQGQRQGSGGRVSGQEDMDYGPPPAGDDDNLPF